MQYVSQWCEYFIWECKEQNIKPEQMQSIACRLSDKIWTRFWWRKLTFHLNRITNASSCRATVAQNLIATVGSAAWNCHSSRFIVTEIRNNCKTEFLRGALSWILRRNFYRFTGRVGNSDHHVGAGNTLNRGIRTIILPHLKFRCEIQRGHGKRSWFTTFRGKLQGRICTRFSQKNGTSLRQVGKDAGGSFGPTDLPYASSCICSCMR